MKGYGLENTLLFLTGFLIAKISLPFILTLFSQQTVLKKNWLGNLIPGVTGLVFSLIINLASLPLLIFGQENARYFVYLFAINSTALLGLLDDILGDSGQKGFRGHFILLFRHRRISTGLIKAVGSGVIALWIVVFLRGTSILIDWLLLVLNINLINLLDLRPGRAIKATIIVFLIALILPLSDYRLLAITAGIILAYARFDLKGYAMLGDTGSNTLGMITGLILLQATTAVKIIIVIVLVVIHITAEKYSFSEIIEGNRLLNKIDKWGRGDC